MARHYIGMEPGYRPIVAPQQGQSVIEAFEEALSLSGDTITLSRDVVERALDTMRRP